VVMVGDLGQGRLGCHAPTIARPLGKETLPDGPKGHARRREDDRRS